MENASFDLDEALSLTNDATFDPHEYSPRLPENCLVHQNSVIREIANMPMVLMNDSRYVCVVCMEGFESSVGGKQVPCGHVYHAACISQWLFHTNRCPLCRTVISGGEKGAE